jgi:hypothetical protein
MTFPKSPGDFIDHNDLNATQTILEDIMGIGENGYGLTSILSNPVAVGRKVNATQWNYLLSDMNTVEQHITGSTSTTLLPVTTASTAIIYASTVTNIYNNTVALQPNRYHCDPSQFLISDGGSSTIFYGGGDSSRTSPWGVATSSITHHVTTQFPNRLAARYYFNLGCYLTYTPYYNGTGLNDLDTEWANFIDYLRAATPYTYDRQKFVTYDSVTTEWTSGTLFVSIQADRAVDQASIDFTVIYRNNASPNLLISPAVGIYTITL